MITDNNYINENYKHSDITSKIIGCALEVHKFLGNGFQEVIYQRALAIEMEAQKLQFSRGSLSNNHSNNS